MRIQMIASAALCFALAACGGDGDSDTARTSKGGDAATAAGMVSAGLQTWRDERRANLTKPDGWTSLIGLHWLEPGSHYVGSDPDNGIKLAKGPAHMGMFKLQNGKVRFVPEKGAALLLGGEPLSGSTELLTDADEQGPSVIGFDEGKGILTVIKRGERYALRVKHADAETRTGFKGIEYWPEETNWTLTGKFVPNPPGKTIAIANIIGTTDGMPNPGAVEFERDGQTFRIEALDEGGDELFLVFADLTSGHGSYPAGRFLYAPKPDANGKVPLDFNRAYNPPCAFTEFATCPLPPPENRLKLAIPAGEKTYKHAGA